LVTGNLAFLKSLTALLTVADDSFISLDKILGKSDYFLKSWGNENFEFDAEGKKIHPKRILI